MKICKENLNYGIQSGYLKYDNPAYRKAVFDKTYREKIFQIAFSNKELKIDNKLPKKEMKQITIPQNLILYDPPGTGKTYRLTNDYVHLFTDKTEGRSKELFSYEAGLFLISLFQKSLPTDAACCELRM